MVRLAIEDYPCFEIETYEVDREGVSFTIDTVEYLKTKYDNLCMICGADLLFEIERWKDWEKLLETLSFRIANRPPYTKEQLKERAAYFNEKYSADIKIIEGFEMTNVSSTQIRQDILRKKTLNIPEKVAQYIIENNLYLD